MTASPERRFELRIAADTRAVVLADGLELSCRIVDQSASGLKIRLDRPGALPRQLIVVDIAAGVAVEADLAWSRPPEAGLKRRGQTGLTGLVPSRLAPARDVWRRLTGR